MVNSQTLGRERGIADPVYKYVVVPAQLERVLAHPMVQRLRRISQTGLASQTYPSLNGDRFEHALGAMHLACVGWQAAWENSDRDTRDRFRDAFSADMEVIPSADFASFIRACVGCVALLHDVGHPPYSHAMEPLLVARPELFLGREIDGLSRAEQPHEYAGVALTRMIVKSLDRSLREAVLRVYEAVGEADPSWARSLRGMVSGEIDVDRIDYLVRDMARAGTEYGSIDASRLLGSLEIFELDVEGERQFTIAPGVRARSAAEKLLIERSQAYRWVYFHPRVVASDLSLRRALETLLELEDLVTHFPPPDWGSKMSVGEMLASIRPNLNYVTPGADDEMRLMPEIARMMLYDNASHLVAVERDVRARRSRSPEIDRLVQRDQDRARELYAGYFDLVRGAVDDGAVLTWLQRALALCELLKSWRVLSDTDPLVLRFLRYARSVILRSPACLTVWKSHEDYADLAALVFEGDAIERTFDSAFASYCEGLDSDQRVLAARRFDNWRVRLDAEVQVSPVLALNRVIDAVVAGRTELLVEHFSRTIGPIDPSVEGFWDFEYRDFNSVRGSSQVAKLYSGHGAEARAVALRDTSPMVSALQLVDLARTRLFAHLFWTTSGGTETPGHAELRQRAREAFAPVFREFVLVMLPDFMRQHGWGEEDWRSQDD